MKFYFFGFLYLFIFFGSIYGLCVSELNFGLGADSKFNIALSGWGKNITCMFGLFLVGAVPACPIIAAVYRALERGGK